MSSYRSKRYLQLPVSVRYHRSMAEKTVEGIAFHFVLLLPFWLLFTARDASEICNFMVRSWYEAVVRSRYDHGTKYEAVVRSRYDHGTIEVLHATFFSSRFSQLGSFRPLPKTDLEKRENCKPMNQFHDLGYYKILFAKKI